MKVTYDLTGVDDLPDEPHAPVGTYIGKIESAEAKPSSKGNPMIEVRWRLTHNATGAKLKDSYQAIWDYPILEHDSKFVMGKTKAFFAAVGVPLKGTLDTKKIEGKKALLKLKSDTDDGGDYRPRIGKILPVSEVEPAEVEEEPEAEVEEAEEESIDLSELDRDELKKLIRSEKLGTLADLGIKSSTSDDDIRAIIAGKMGLDEEEPEPEEEEPEPEPEEEGVDLASLDRAGLKDFIKSEGLGTLADLGINKNTTDDQIRDIIADKMGVEAEEEEAEAEPEPEEEPEGEGDGYDSMDIKALAADFKERSLDEAPLKGLKGAKLKAKVIELLRADDAESPF
jgi:acyl carrier protein